MKYKLLYLGDYHKYWLDKSARVKNPTFDGFSGRVLDVKEQKPGALIFFARRIDPLIPEEAVVCSVPSHDAAKLQSGIKLIAQRLCVGKRIDGTSCLKRYKSVPKSAYGGPRNIHIHLESIRVENPEIIANKDVYVLDDVVTTGSSLEVCAQLLDCHGAVSVTCLALGKTVPER